MSNDAFDKIVHARIPVLFIDTCSVLDLLRFPKPHKFNVREYSAALLLLLAAEDQQKLAILIAEQVNSELRDHLYKIEDDTKKSIEKLKHQIADAEAVASVYGDLRTKDTHDYLDLYVPLTREVVDRFMNVAIEVCHSENVASKAFARMIKAKTPAIKGKDAIKDCVIIETYLEVAYRLREHGHEESFVFASSDVKDYAQNGGSMPKPDLGEEFDAVILEYAPNFAAAKHQLGI